MKCNKTFKTRDVSMTNQALSKKKRKTQKTQLCIGSLSKTSNSKINDTDI